MKRATIAAILCVFAFVPAVSFAATSFQEDFSNTTTALCQADGSKFGSWEVRYASFGCVKVENGAMVIQPMAATSAGATHAPLVLGPNNSGDLDFSVRMKTDAQIRKNGTPNAWEVAWVLWDYTDDTHFYYVTLKPNGWELGKEDPAYPGAQRFLTTGSEQKFPIGQWYTVRITREANHIKAYVNGSLLTEFTDNERPYSGGRIALYNEDAITRFDDIVIGRAAIATSVPVVAPVVDTVQQIAVQAPAALKAKAARKAARRSARRTARIAASWTPICPNH